MFNKTERIISRKITGLPVSPGSISSTTEVRVRTGSALSGPMLLLFPEHFQDRIFRVASEFGEGVFPY
ncbi:MAG: hypothetical protein GX268_06170 [Methanomicrobiales archaeon]|nr:hypothetical protein [Methanomicrobiales archaeon]